MQRRYLFVMFLLVINFSSACLFDRDPYLEKACKIFIQDLPDDVEVMCDYECSWYSEQMSGSVNLYYTDDKDYLEEFLKQRSIIESGEYKEENFGDVRWSEFHEQAYLVDGEVVVPEENTFHFYIENPNKDYPEKYLGVGISTAGHTFDDTRDKSLEVLKALDGGEIVEVEPENQEKVIDHFEGKNTTTVKVTQITNKNISEMQSEVIDEFDTDFMEEYSQLTLMIKKLPKINNTEIKENKSIYKGMEKVVDKTTKKAKSAHSAASYFSKDYSESKFAKRVEKVFKAKEVVDEIKKTTDDLNELSNIKGASGNLGKVLYGGGKLAEKAGEKIPLFGEAIKVYGKMTQDVVMTIPKKQKAIMEGSWGGEVMHGTHGAYTPTAFMSKHGEGDVFVYTDQNGNRQKKRYINYWKKYVTKSKTYWVPHDEYGEKVGDVALMEIYDKYKIWRNDNVKIVKFSNPSIVYNNGEEYDT